MKPYYESQLKHKKQFKKKTWGYKVYVESNRNVADRCYPLPYKLTYLLDIEISP